MTKNSPSNTLWNHSQFLSYDQKYLRSRQQFLQEPISITGLKCSTSKPSEWMLHHHWIFIFSRYIFSFVIRLYLILPKPNLIIVHFPTPSFGIETNTLLDNELSLLFHTSVRHGLSQQGVWVSFWTPNPLNHPSGHPHFFVRNFWKCQSQAYNWIISSPYNNHDIV